MSDAWTPPSELESLADDACGGSLSEEGAGRLAVLLRDRRACRWYRDYCLLQVELRFLVLADRIDVAARESLRPELEIPDVEEVGIGKTPFRTPNSEFQGSLPLVVACPPSFLHSPLLSPQPSLGRWAFSYVVATMILGTALLAAWTYRISHHVDLARDRSATSSIRENTSPQMAFVGRITGAVDCRWADPKTEVSERDDVPLGCKYDLVSGFLEITYGTGAKIILQGPCRYEVESFRGGYLSLGKLTAKIGERGGGREEGGRHLANRKLEIEHPSLLSPLPSPLFSVRTPTAIVIDLGTEFGVEVERSGASRARVFQGRVEWRSVDNGRGGVRVLQLGVNESARAEWRGSQIVTVLGGAGQPGEFTRQMQRRAPIKRVITDAEAASAPSYRLTNLGTLGGAASGAYGINASGEVVGRSTTAAGATHAFLYSGGRMKDLGTLSGGNSYASGVNAAGQVVGYSGTNDDDYRAFLYSNGVMKDLGTLGGPGATAMAVNDAGQAVGTSKDSKGLLCAYLYTGGRMTKLGNLGGASFAFGVNASGQVVGYSVAANRALHATLCTAGAGVKDLGTLGGAESLAYGINDSGQVVGKSLTALNAIHAFLDRSDLGMKDLGTLGGSGSHAVCINAKGQVVGWAHTTGDAAIHAFVYNSSNGLMIDLNSVIDPASGWTLAAATAINDSGQIVGGGTEPGGNDRAFLLTPLRKEGSPMK